MANNSLNPHNVEADKKLLITMFLILTIGMLAIYSTSFIQAFTYPYPSPSRYFEKQAISAAIGIILMLVLAAMNYTIHLKLRWFYSIVILTAHVVALFFPSHLRAHRWFFIGGFSVQPSEFLKIYILILLAEHISSAPDKMRTFWYGIFYPFLRLAILSLLVLVEPDLSTFFLIILITLTLLYIGGCKKIHLFLSITAVGIAFFVAYKFNRIPLYQIKRFTDFIAGNNNIQSEAGKLAMMHGGLLGVGLGEGSLKYYLPMQFTDFIAATIGEELGFVGISVIIFLYFGMMKYMFDLVFTHITDDFGRMFMIGYAVLIAYQMLVNLGVIAGLLPVTGMTLPFISYGGSSLISLLMGFGIVLSIIRRAE